MASDLHVLDGRSHIPQVGEARWTRGHQSEVRCESPPIRIRSTGRSIGLRLSQSVSETAPRSDLVHEPSSRRGWSRLEPRRRRRRVHQSIGCHTLETDAAIPRIGRGSRWNVRSATQCPQRYPVRRLPPRPPTPFQGRADSSLRNPRRDGRSDSIHLWSVFQSATTSTCFARIDPRAQRLAQFLRSSFVVGCTENSMLLW